jgi:hypothetical protein
VTAIEIDLEHTYYDVLGINRGADADSIKAAYRRLTKIHHPDLGGDVETFAAINVAFAALRDTRADYDSQLAAATARATEPVIPDDWEPEEWVEDEVDLADDVWDEEVVDAPVAPLAVPLAVPEPVYVPATAATVKGNAPRVGGGIALVLLSFAVSNFLAGRMGVAWVVYSSSVVCFMAFFRSIGSGRVVFAGELALSGLMVWGALAWQGLVGFLVALGVLAPIIIAAELFHPLTREAS